MGSTRVVELKDLAGELGAFTDEHLANLKKATIAGIVKSIPDLVAASPVDTGLYANSWDFTVTEQSAIIGNTAPHAAVSEDGARPFTPPIRPLLAWAKRVLKDTSQPPEYSPEVRSLAYGVQQKIAREGMAPKHILMKAIPTILENIKQEYANLGR